MENIKKDEWLYEEFGIRREDMYVLYTTEGKIIKGNIIYYGCDKIIIKSQKGLYILPHHLIEMLKPLPIEEGRFNVGDILEIKKEFVATISKSIYLLNCGSKIEIKEIDRKTAIINWYGGITTYEFVVGIDVLNKNCVIVKN